MRKLFLNPFAFQGEKKLNRQCNYFEGWYFKNGNDQDGISFIPGIHINDGIKKAFIQVITKSSSYYINYNIDDFAYNFENSSVKIGNNFFSINEIHIDILDEEQNVRIYGDIYYSKHKNIKTSFLCPNIMGPFSFIPFMECNHAIFSMKSLVNGIICLNEKELIFEDDISYIEKDWGCSFPKSYIWMQGNNFQNPNASFMISIADIPFKLFHFKGFICVLLIDNKEYRFTTYNIAKLIEERIDNDTINITLKKGAYKLHIKSKYIKGNSLIAPYQGKMDKNILESISSTITITLKKDNKILFADTSLNCGLEIVKELY